MRTALPGTQLEECEVEQVLPSCTYSCTTTMPKFLVSCHCNVPLLRKDTSNFPICHSNAELTGFPLVLTGRCSNQPPKPVH